MRNKECAYFLSLAQTGLTGANAALAVLQLMAHETACRNGRSLHNVFGWKGQELAGVDDGVLCRCILVRQ